MGTDFWLRLRRLLPPLNDARARCNRAPPADFASGSFPRQARYPPCYRNVAQYHVNILFCFSNSRCGRPASRSSPARGFFSRWILWPIEIFVNRDKERLYYHSYRLRKPDHFHRFRKARNIYSIWYYVNRRNRAV